MIPAVLDKFEDVIPEAATVMPPDAFVIVMPEPGVIVVLVNPVPLPISICPFNGAVVKPVPPLATAIAVPLQTPLVIVPTVFKFDKEVNVVLLVAVMFPAVMAVLAVPDKFPTKFVEVTDVNPATFVKVPPAAILVEPIVIGG